MRKQALPGAVGTRKSAASFVVNSGNLNGAPQPRNGRAVVCLTAYTVPVLARSVEEWSRRLPEFSTNRETGRPVTSRLLVPGRRGGRRLYGPSKVTLGSARLRPACTLASVTTYTTIGELFQLVCTKYYAYSSAEENC